MTLTHEQRQMPDWELNLRAAVDRMLEATGGSEYWKGDLSENLLILEGARLTQDKQTLLAGVERVAKWFDAQGVDGETEGALMDMKDAIALYYKEDEPAPYEPEPVNEGYEMSGRDCDRAAGMHFGNLNAQHP